MNTIIVGGGVGLVLVGLNLNYFAAHKWNEHHLTGIAAAMMTGGGLAAGYGAQL